MSQSHSDSTTSSTAAETDAAAIRLPVQSRTARFLVLLAVFICAACGLVYELALVAIGSYLLGDTITQASVVLSVMVFAMGVGSLLSKRLQARPALSFAVVEGLLSLLGGLSVLMLYGAFAWWSMNQPALIAIAFVLGVLIGAEIPLLMTLLRRIRAQDPAETVADLFAADYVGGLLGGLAFPFLLLPVFGLPKGVLVVGILNAAVGVAIVLWMFRDELTRPGRVVLGCGLGVVVVALGAAFWATDQFEMDARQALYRDPIVHAERSEYQEIIVTSATGEADVRMYLNGDLQFSTRDEYRYHESLVHPAMTGERERVLVLGGGDGFALREVLRYDGVDEVTLVDLDPAVVDLASSEPLLRDLNEDAFVDPRVSTVHDDAFQWLRENTETFDVVIADLPDGSDVDTAKLYSAEFYTLLGGAMTENARAVVQGGSPYFAADAYWTVGASIEEGGMATTPYHVDVPSFGDWGFFLAVPGDEPADLSLPEDATPRRFLTAAVLEAAQTFPPDVEPREAVDPSTLLHPRVMEQHRHAWQGY